MSDMDHRFSSLDPSAIIFSTPESQRLERLTWALTQARAALRNAASGWDRTRDGATVDKLEAAVRNEEQQRAARAERLAAIEAEQAAVEQAAAARWEHERQARATHEQAVERALWRSANPAGTDAEFAAQYPEIVARRTAEKTDAMRTAQRGVYRI